MIGTVISGRYAIEAIVGTGGMAVVYRAWDRRKKRMVAVKVLRPEFEGDQEFVRRFSREAEAASKMSHENIVNMYDVGIDGNMRYIVMELVEGVTLKDMIREMGHLGADAVVRMGIRILAAVDHAHKNGIVHRDIKPQNILVNREGKVKVADFGIARLKAQQTTRVGDATSSALGSVHYLSPEQASGEIADEKSDLYSVGVVLYEMLTGQVPFDGDTAVSVALKHVSEEPKSLRALDPAIPRSIDEVVMCALRKDPSERYQSAAAMAIDLKKALSHPEGGFTKPSHASDSAVQKARVEIRPEPKPIIDPRARRARTKRRVKYVALGVCVALALCLAAAAVLYTLYMPVPSLTGLSETTAIAALDEDFNAVVRREYNDIVPEGLVIAQTPASGVRAMRGGDVVIIVSRGASYVNILDYSGTYCDDAMRELVAAGISNVAITYVADAAEVGTVVRQEPGAGEVPRGANVILYVSGETVTAPTVTGYTLENAIASITNEGLVVGNVSEAYSADAASGTVIAQSVAPNSEVVIGSTIDLTIAQAQKQKYYPASDFRVVAPLNNTAVRISVVTPSGAMYDMYTGILDMGTHSITLSSDERGEHTLSVYLDESLLEELLITFE